MVTANSNSVLRKWKSLAHTKYVDICYVFYIIKLLNLFYLTLI